MNPRRILSVVAPYLILALAVFAAYSNIFGNAFLYDDLALIRANEYLRDWSHIGQLLTGSTTSGAHILGGFYRPLQMLIYLLLFHLSDGSPFWFHFLNLSLHMANTCFVYRLGTKLEFKPWGVFLAALVWGVHPLHTEAIDYISAVSEPLFSCFCLGSLVILAPDFSPNKIFKIVPLFVLGLMSKEAAAMFPLLVMACLFLVSPERLKVRTYLRTWPLWGLTLIYVVWRLHADGFFSPQFFAPSLASPDFAAAKMYADHPVYRIYTFLATLPSYVGLLIWPHDLHIARDFPLYNLSLSEAVRSGPVMMGLGIALVATAQIVRSMRKPGCGIEMSWGLLWGAAAYAPDSGILLPVNELLYEHWMYLPSIGLFLGIAETLAKLVQNRPRALFACSAAVLAFAGAMFCKTYEQNKVWRDPVSFFGNIIRYNERSAMAHGNLGVYYVEKGDNAEAFEQLKRAIEISDNQPAIRYGMALAYLRMPDQRAHIPDAIANLKRSLELDPNYYSSNKKLSEIYDFLGDKDKAGYYRDRAEAVFSSKK